ncbi:hypothetical protein HanXRQr2_Chr13g0565301 [Helianthus annuus]|uniref:Uncharacterized protein n=1 Tax=Helianthus annuus TaxID=4232 RepID=A0A9K3ED99_HELAN|nr:hypothetical protein HanXRQr2_Chr13g0565301 [Helianthus annuus]KAJ0496066.1 hypothetical protein HanHA89_Chr13g0495461 [Helianthus annuus]KAJ0662126.1 hypothetical protein HanLR1_Chr13g0465941 [Helianthus annuus]
MWRLNQQNFCGLYNVTSYDNCPRSFSWNSPSLLVRFTRNRNAINVDLSRYKKAS